jgi:hypothetical protein
MAGQKLHNTAQSFVDAMTALLMAYEAKLDSIKQLVLAVLFIDDLEHVSE